MRKIRVKAKMLEDADVQFISLVDRPANRTPFRVMKVERTKSESSMIELGKRFFSKIASDSNKQAADVMTARPSVIAVAVRKQKGVDAAPQLIEFGQQWGVVDGKIEDVDGMTVYKVSDEEGVPLALSKDAVVFLGNAECVKKAFSSYTESDSFDENLKVGGLMPGIGLSTEILMQTVNKLLYASDNRAEAVQKFRSVLDSYSKHVLSLVKGLPDTVFKMEAQLWAEPAAPAVVPANEEIAVKEDTATETPEAQAAAVEPVAEEVIKSETTIDIEAQGATEAVAETVTETLAEVIAEPVAKAETPDFAALLNTALSPLMENVSKLAESVNALTAKQTELEAKVVETAQKADTVTEAVRGTVVSRASDDDYNPLGLREQSVRKKSDSDAFWGGTSLEKIAG